MQRVPQGQGVGAQQPSTALLQPGAASPADPGQVGQAGVSALYSSLK